MDRGAWWDRSLGLLGQSSTQNGLNKENFWPIVWGAQDGWSRGWDYITRTLYLSLLDLLASQCCPLSHGGWLPTAVCVCWVGVHGGWYRQSKLQWVEESSSLLNLHFKSQERTSTTDCCCRSTQSRGCGRFRAGSRSRPSLWPGVMDTMPGDPTRTPWWDGEAGHWKWGCWAYVKTGAP